MQVKIFGVRGDSCSPKVSLQAQINEFIQNKTVKDIKFQVVQNFLPHTTSSEYIEVMYAMVIYEE